MAGSYPDNPSRRMAWDNDGTIGFLVTDSSGVPSVISDANTELLNNETNSFVSGAVANQWLVNVFPELRELDGLFHSRASGGNIVTTFSSSGDTTNGQDGTWTVRTTDYPNYYASYPNQHRNNIESYAVPNVRGIRIRNLGNGNGFQSHHIYGEISPGQTPDRLLFIQAASGLEFGLPIDYGDVPRGSAADTDIKLRNNSGSLTAGGIQITAEDIALGSGAWYTFDEGSGFQATLALASSIGPGADSPTITVRRVIPDAASLGPHTARAYASVGSWT